MSMHALRGLVAGKLCQRCRRVWRDVADHGFDVDFADVAQGAPAQAFLHKFGPRCRFGPVRVRHGDCK